MINIIEHIWQSEFQYYEVIPAVIKISKNTPKSYFYSAKQSKVLRRKEQTLESAMKVLLLQQNTDNQFLMIKMIKPSCIEYGLIHSSQISEYICECEANFAVMALSYKKVSNLVYYTFQFGKKNRAALVMSLSKDNKTWLPKDEEQVLPISKAESVHKFSCQFIQSLMTQLKLDSLKLQKMQLVLCSDNNLDQFYIAWCNKLIFSQYNFYQIDYKVYNNTKILSQKQNKVKPTQIQLNYKQQQKLGQSNAKVKQQCQNMVYCYGCGNLLNLQQAKQISNQQVIILRKKHSLSIMGLFDQYFNVCLACYQSAST